MPTLQERAARIRLAIFDVDGVLTDGRLYMGDDGIEYKAFHIRDGHGIKMLLNNDIEVAIISGRHSRAVQRRMAELGVTRVHLGVENKAFAFAELLAELQLNAEQVAYLGDDVIDLTLMDRVGLAAAVGDGDPFVQSRAHWQTPSAGGHGAVREFCELLLEAQGRLRQEQTRYTIPDSPQAR